MSKDIGFSNYGKLFQESLAQMILDDRPFADQIEEVLDTNFFELKYLRVFVSKIYDYRKKYGVHPTKQILASILRTELEFHNDALQKQVRDYFARTLIKAVDDEKYIKETSLDFCKKQKLKEALMQSVDLIQNSSFDEVRKVIDDALKLGNDNDFGHDFIKDFQLRYEVKARNPISTGWEKIDALTKKGLGSGELGVIIAPTGAGKSMVLAHLGAQAVKAGKNVVHYTLELSEAVTGQRYDSCISGVPLSTLFHQKDEVLESISEIEGSLIIKEYPTKSASTNTLRSHLEKLKKKNHKIEHIFIEQALMFFRRGGSTAKTMSILQRFNGIVSWQCYQIFKMEPNYVTPISARSKCGIKVAKGKKAKEVVMEHFIQSKEFQIDYTRYGNVQKYCYDIADAVVVARAGHYLLQENTENV